MTARVLALVLAFVEHCDRGVFVLTDRHVCALPRQAGDC